VDAGLDENQAEFGVLILAISLEVLADSNGLKGWVSAIRGFIDQSTYLLDQHIEVLWDFRSEAYFVSPSVKDQAEAILLYCMGSASLDQIQ
jgi:hypothetical protein